MSCNLSAGRQEVCKESVGGLQGVYFMNYPSSSYNPTFTTDGSGTITAFPSGSTVYFYQLKGNSAYTETVNSSRDNGTTFFSQALTLNLKKLTAEMTTQLKLMAFGRPVAIVWTTNGEALVAGLTKGTDLTGGTISTGAGLGDMFGYNIQMLGLEPLPAQFISGSTSTNPFASVTNAPTVVTGSAA
jgi:hypothetical protein